MTWQAPPAPTWLEQAICYHCFVPSFQDSNGDGIGDLDGLRQRMPYLKSLGINTLWLSPIFDSPFQDAGYDVRDYFTVARRYGGNDAFGPFLEAAHAAGIRVILDLVAGHTSIEHPWFRDASAHAPETERDTYIWSSDTFARTPEGYRFVRGYSQRDAAFMTNFFWFQPALNYGWAKPDPAYPWMQPPDAPACQRNQARLRDIMAYWLDQGVDGFRVDMAGSFIKGRAEDATPVLQTFWQSIRTWMSSRYPETVLISEWSNPLVSLTAGFHVDFMLAQHCHGYMKLMRHYELDADGNEYCASYLHPNGLGDVNDWLTTYQTWYDATRGQGLISVPTGTHDIPRRLHDDRSPEDAKLAFLFLLGLPGMPTLYYGDEIGMRYQHGLPSKEGAYHRTGQRTPMQWTSDLQAGFSTADPDKLYLPVNHQHADANVDAQEKDPDSVLHFVRRVLDLRRNHTALKATARFRVVAQGPRGYPLVYERHDHETQRRLWFCFNPGGQPATLQHADFATLNGTHHFNHGVACHTYTIQFAPSSYAVIG